MSQGVVNHQSLSLSCATKPSVGRDEGESHRPRTNQELACLESSGQMYGIICS